MTFDEIMQGCGERFGDKLPETDGTLEAITARNRKVFAREIEQMQRQHRSVKQREEVCPLCDGTGFAYIGDAFPDERAGYPFVYPCVCQRQRRAERLLKESGLDAAVREMTLEHFQTPEQWQGQLLDMGRHYIGALLDKKTGRRPWLYVGGQPGCGKTHLCTAVCGKLLAAGMSVRYVLWTREARMLKAHAAEPDFETLLAPLADAPVLYLDDVLKPVGGDGALTSADLRLLFEIVNRRYIRDLPTIFSGELSLSDITAADEAIGSRITERTRGFCCHVAKGKGRNWRMRESA